MKLPLIKNERIKIKNKKKERKSHILSFEVSSDLQS